MDLLKWCAQVNVLLNNCQQNTTTLSLLAGRTVGVCKFNNLHWKQSKLQLILQHEVLIKASRQVYFSSPALLHTNLIQQGQSSSGQISSFPDIHILHKYFRIAITEKIVKQQVNCIGTML